MKCMITGAAGFFGSHLLRHLLTETDWDFVLPVSLDHQGHLTRLDSARKGFAKRRTAVVPWDLSQVPSTEIKRVLGTPDYVIHCASNSDVQLSIDEPAPFVVNNYMLQVNLLEWARTQPQLKAFLNFSTDEVYGPAPAGVDFPEWSPILPSNPYSASKASQECLAIAYWRTYGLPLVITNVMNLVGEYQADTKYLAMLIKKILNDEEVTVHATAEGVPGSRHYLHARNAADAVLFLLKNVTPQLYDGSEGCRPDRFNIPGDMELDNLELAEMIAGFLGKPLHYKLVDHHTSRPGHDRRYALDGKKMADMGWAHPVPLTVALKNVVEWKQLPAA
jgi:dTDP-glucose 4,6-dehydratase